jgi:ArsR family transcriptional regulator
MKPNPGKKGARMKEKENEDLYELHAGFCKVIANSTRLKIFSVLSDGEQSVGGLAKATGSSLANVSQHLRILRDHNILRMRKEGRTVYYRLRDPRLVQACELTRTILMSGIQERSALARRSTTEGGSVRATVEAAAAAPLPRLRTSPRATAAHNHQKS